MNNTFALRGRNGMPQTVLQSSAYATDCAAILRKQPADW